MNKCFKLLGYLTVKCNKLFEIYFVFQTLGGGHYLWLVEKKTLEREGVDPRKTSDLSVLSNLK